MKKNYYKSLIFIHIATIAFGLIELLTDMCFGTVFVAMGSIALFTAIKGYK